MPTDEDYPLPRRAQPLLLLFRSNPPSLRGGGGDEGRRREGGRPPTIAPLYWHAFSSSPSESKFRAYEQL